MMSKYVPQLHILICMLNIAICRTCPKAVLASVSPNACICMCTYFTIFQFTCPSVWQQNCSILFYNCSMFCCTLLYVHSSIAIILMGKRELVALLNLSSWCLVMVERLFLAMPRGCLRFVIVVFPIILTYYFCIKKFRR